MMPTVLLIQFRKNQTAAELEFTSMCRQCAGLVALERVSALDEGALWHDPEGIMAPYQGVIFGGSGDFDFDGGRDPGDEAVTMSFAILDRLTPLLHHIFIHDIPTLGICFGHQLLGAFRGAVVVHDYEQKKTRSHSVRLAASPEDHQLLQGLPDTFDAHYVHKDSLDRVPEGASLLMDGGVECRFSALRYGTNIYSTQFHPELTFEDVLVRVDLFPGYLADGVNPEAVFSKSTESNTVLRNFAALVVHSTTRAIEKS
jgi:GMP synthase (glutamine-hydrolysing)